MSDIIGFSPIAKQEKFQGEPVDPSNGLIGFKPMSDEEADTPQNEAILKQSDKQADLLAQQVEAKQSGDYQEGVISRIDNLSSNVVEPLTRPVSGVLGRAGDAVNNALFSAQGRDDLRGNVTETALKQPIVDLPRAGQAESGGGRVVAGAYNAVADLLSSFTAPDTLAVLPAAANKVVLTTWLTQMAGHAPQRVIDAKKKFDEGDTQGGVREVGTGLGELLMVELGRRHLMPAEKPQVKPPGRTVVDTGKAGDGIERPQIPDSPLTPKFELREGETWKQLNARIEGFQTRQKQITDWIDVEVENPRKLLEDPAKSAYVGETTKLQDNPALTEVATTASALPKPEPVKPVEKVEPVAPNPELPSMPAVESFKEVPDSHPAVQFWTSPESAAYARKKAAEAFPDNPSMAADISTEAHAHLYLSAGNMPETGSAKPWGMRVMSNYILDKARAETRDRSRREAVVEGSQSAMETAPDAAPTPDAVASMTELESVVNRLADGLNPADRMVYDTIMGRSDRTFADIAKEQGISPSTMTRRVQEVRGRLAQGLQDSGVDVSDYIEVMDGIGEPKGIGASARKKFKSGARDEGGFINPSILAPLGRIIGRWLKAGASAARAVGHAVKLFGQRVFAPAARIARSWGFGAPGQVLGRARPLRPIRPFTAGPRSNVARAVAKHPGSWRRPAEWAALDVFEKGGLPELAEAGSRYESRVQELVGRWTTPNAIIEQKYPVAEYKQGAKEFGEYFKLREARDGVTKAQAEANANAYHLTMSPAGKELVAWQREVVREMGDISRTMAVQVQEPGGHWRMGNFNNDHYPRRPTEDFRDILKDSNKRLAEFNQLKADMVANGNAPTLDAAEAMLRKEGWQDKSTQGFFANAEKARGVKLPDRVYEYSLPDFIEYVDRNADRLSQIEAFGQSLGGTADTIFEVAKSKTTDTKMVNAIKDLRNHYYRDPLTTAPSELARKASTVTMVGYLGLSPLTAARNVLTAGLNSATVFGVTPTAVHAGRVALGLLESAAKTSLNIMGGDFKSARTRDSLAAQEIGSVMHDLHAASLMDAGADGFMAKTVKVAMSLNSMAERVGREVTDGASMTWLRHSRAIIANNPTGYRARVRKANLARVGFTGTKLTELLNGGPDVEAEFRRVMVGETQFGYRAKHASTAFDKAWIKVFAQFQKFGFMASRFGDRQAVQPLTQKVDGKWTVDIAPLVRLLAGAVIAGELYQETREKAFNKPRKTASLKEIRVTASEDATKAMGLVAQRLFTSLVYGSGLGIIGDYAGYAMEFGDRGRFKNPLDPPVFTMAEQVAGVLASRAQRGATWEGVGDDVDRVLSKFPAYSQAKGATERIAKATGGDKGYAALAESRFVKAEAAPLLKRFGKEMGISRPSKFNASTIVLDENSADLDAINTALMSGDRKEAARIATAFVKESPDKKRAINVLQGSIDRRNPLYSTTAGVDTPEKVDAFINWVRKFDPEKARLFTKVFLRYESAK